MFNRTLNLYVFQNHKTFIMAKKLFYIFFVTIFSLFFLELLVDRFLPGILVYSELKNKNAFKDHKVGTHFFYFIDFSPYLPFTLPKNRTGYHSWDGPGFSDYRVSYETNDLRYRGEYPKSFKLPVGKKRILFLGDSFTFGFGNFESTSFVGLIKDALPEKKFEVVNGGYHAGPAPDSYYAYLNKEGIFLNSSIIVTNIYSGNDVSDIASSLWLEMDQQNLPRKVYSIHNYGNFEGRYINFLRDSLYPWNYKIPYLKQSRSFIGLTNIVNKFFFPKSYEFVKGKFGKPLDMQVSTERLKRSIEGIQSFCDSRDIICIFTVLPSAKVYSKKVGSNTFEVEHSKILNKLNETKITHLIDLKPYLDRSAFFKNDAHLNPTGNRKVKEAILGYFKNNSLLFKN